MKAFPYALAYILLMVGCGEPIQPIPDPTKSSNTPVSSSSPKSIDLDDNETRYRILTEAVEESTLGTFISGGQLFYYSPNEEKPRTGLLFTGWTKELYDNEEVSRLNQFKDGTLNGLCAEWYYNGQKELESNIKDGKKDGIHTTWYENGYKRRKTNYKEGKRDGLSTNWYKNGQKSSEESFKNEKLMTAIVWKPKGEKCTATNIKGGNGVKVDAYYEDGTEVIRSIYKDGSRLEDSALSP